MISVPDGQRIILSAKLLQTAATMPKFAANLSFLFNEVSFPERFARAAKAGFRGAEFMFPYEYPAEQVAGWLAEAGLEMVLFNLPPGDWAVGERGLACLPGREADFRAAVEQAVAYSRVLGCRRLHCMAGLTPAGEDDAATRARYVGNLRHAADCLAAEDVQVLIEPINSRIDMPGYWLDTPAAAFALLAEIDRPNVAVQFDCYHARIMAGDPLPWLEDHLAKIGHIQIADYPDRHEPGSGDIDYPRLFRRLDELGYSGWVGCEYRPRAGTEEGLLWLRQQVAQ